MLTRDSVSCTLTVTDNATATPDIAIQFTGGSEEAVKEPIVFDWMICLDANGQGLAADGTDTTEIAIGTDGTILVEDVADIMGRAISEADGDADFTVTVVDGKEVYFIVILPNGKLVASELLTWAS